MLFSWSDRWPLNGPVVTRAYQTSETSNRPGLVFLFSRHFEPSNSSQTPQPWSRLVYYFQAVYYFLSVYCFLPAYLSYLLSHSFPTSHIFFFLFLIPVLSLLFSIVFKLVSVHYWLSSLVSFSKYMFLSTSGCLHITYQAYAFFCLSDLYLSTWVLVIFFSSLPCAIVLHLSQIFAILVNLTLPGKFFFSFVS